MFEFKKHMKQNLKQNKYILPHITTPPSPVQLFVYTTDKCSGVYVLSTECNRNLVAHECTVHLSQQVV